MSKYTEEDFKEEFAFEHFPLMEKMVKKLAKLETGARTLMKNKEIFKVDSISMERRMVNLVAAITVCKELEELSETLRTELDR